MVFSVRFFSWHLWKCTEHDLVFSTSVLPVLPMEFFEIHSLKILISNFVIWHIFRILITAFKINKYSNSNGEVL